jgi:hypothetical protein
LSHSSNFVKLDRVVDAEQLAIAEINAKGGIVASGATSELSQETIQRFLAG